MQCYGVTFHCGFAIMFSADTKENVFISQSHMDWCY